MRALLVIWADAAWHPTVAFTSQLLSERGMEVTILYRTPPSDKQLPGAVDYGRGVRLRGIGQGPRGWKDKLAYLHFIAQVTLSVRQSRPEVIVGYDLSGIAPAYLARLHAAHSMLIYHNFDLTLPDGLGTLGQILKRIEMAAARQAECVIVSSKGRASILQDEASLLRPPVVVMNCQRLPAPRVDRGELRSLLAAGGYQFDTVIARMGSIWPGNAIEPLIRSVPLWPDNTGLILAGGSDPHFLDKMKQLTSNLGLDRRVVFLSPVSYGLWYDILYSASVGIALYEPVNVNNQNMAGAGNKLNLYLKAGLPSILPDLPDFEEFRRRFDVGPVADPRDPSSIASAVCSLLHDPERYETCRAAARLAFESEYNFEAQFRPVLDRILARRQRHAVPVSERGASASQLRR